MNRTSTGRLRCIPPIISKKAIILILGTFPSELSLKKDQYYGNPKNHFWEIIGHCIGIKDFEKRSYEERIRHLIKNRIGLWDAIESCERVTSSDAKITKENYNDLSIIRKKYPDIRKIVLSSKFMLQTKARRDILDASEIPYEAAPSPSRRYVIPLDDKKKRWKDILDR